MLLEVEPLGELGNSAASRVSMTRPNARSMTDTLLSFELHTYNSFPSRVISISLGLSPTEIGARQMLRCRSKRRILSQPQQLMYNSFPFGESLQS